MPAQISSLFAKAKKLYTEAEKRTAALTPRQLTLLISAFAIAFLAIGLILGFILSSYSQPPANNFSSNGGGEQTVSETGTVRRLSQPENKANFYLEKSDGTKLLLESDTIDSSFLGIYEGGVVTIEGTLDKTSDGKKEVLFVKKIVVK